MWRKANSLRWIAEFRHDPWTGSTGFAAGFLYGAATTFFDHVHVARHSAMAKGIAFQDISPILTGVLGIAFFIWLSGTFRLPRKRGVLFILCVFPGALVELLLSGIVAILAGTIP
jgi:hypothetical protein